MRENELKDALERIRPWLADAITDGGGLGREYTSGKDYGYFKSEVTGSVARLRLDWELNDEAVTDATTDDEIARLMLANLEGDLEDVIVNGDFDNTSDPLLKVWNGEKKRQKSAVDVDIFRATLFRELKPKKKSTEYTLYLLLHADWQ